MQVNQQAFTGRKINLSKWNAGFNFRCWRQEAVVLSKIRALEKKSFPFHNIHIFKPKDILKCKVNERLMI